MNLAEITALTEDQSREYLESIRWPNGPVCPHCKSTNSVKLQGKSTRPGLYKCKAPACRKQFTVTVGTIFERSHVALRHWVIAFHLICASKKGMLAHQIHRQMGVTYKTAWFMCHRIRHAMSVGSFDSKLQGVIEADETYVGGKPRAGEDRKKFVGRGTKKTPIVALVQRDGGVRAKVVRKLTAKNLRAFIEENVDKSATLMTDEFKSYIKIGREFARHGVIKHKDGIYSIGDVTTNTAESFFALFKRGVFGIFHHVSPEHMQRYLDEFCFRYDRRKISDGERTRQALGAAEGKRLTYR